MNGSASLDHPRHQIKTATRALPPPPSTGATCCGPWPIPSGYMRHGPPAGAQPPTTAWSVGELADVLKLPQSTVSRHLKALCDATLGCAARPSDGQLDGLIGSATSPTKPQFANLAPWPNNISIPMPPPRPMANASCTFYANRRNGVPPKNSSAKLPPKRDHPIRQQWFWRHLPLRKPCLHFVKSAMGSVGDLWHRHRRHVLLWLAPAWQTSHRRRTHHRHAQNRPLRRISKTRPLATR